MAHHRLLRLCHASHTGLTSTTRRPVAPALLHLSRASGHRASRTGSAHRAARRRLLRLRRASGCLSTSRGSSSTTSPTPRVRVPQHVAWLVARLVVDYFANAARPSASARHTARRRLLLLHRASGCLGMSPGSSSTTSPHAAPRRLLRLRRASGCLGTSSTTSPRAARRRLLRLCRASRCLGQG
jgi:hypothetical protein